MRPDRASTQDADENRLNAVRRFADNVLEQGRDRWTGRSTPLLADGLNLETGRPAVWRYDGEEFIVHNLAGQQNLFRVLAGLTNLTGEARYKDTAEAAIRFHFDHLAADCGLLRWGGHRFVDLQTLQPVGRFDCGHHEFKCNFPCYELMWQVDAGATARFIRALWNAHILDWGTLDMNRHGAYGQERGDLWDNEFEDPEPFFEGDGLTFINCGSDMIYAGMMLYALGGEEGARRWAERLAHQYVKARHPDTGLGAYQYSKPRRRRRPPDRLTHGGHTTSRYGDRAENQFAAEFGDVAREGWVLWGERVRRIYAHNALVQLALADRLGERGERLLRWTTDGIAALLEHAYDPATNSFRPMWADGTDLTGYVITNYGYYNRTGEDLPLEPLDAGALFLAACARAFRLSGEKRFWKAVRNMARGNGLGDPGGLSDGTPSLNLDTDRAEPQTIFAVLEMHRARPRPDYLRLARVLAANLIEQRLRDGFFLPDEDLVHAHFDVVEPLALLAVEATVRGRPEAVPEYVAGRGHIHGKFDGLGRTYDRDAIWSRTRER